MAVHGEAWWVRCGRCGCRQAERQSSSLTLTLSLAALVSVAEQRRGACMSVATGACSCGRAEGGKGREGEGSAVCSAALCSAPTRLPLAPFCALPAATAATPHAMCP